MRTSIAGACAALLALSCIRGGDPPVDPHPEWMEPNTGSAVVPVRVVIHGDGFLLRPLEEQSGGDAELEVRHRAWLGGVELEDVTWVDTRTLNATVPAGLSPGVKQLLVENAFGRRGALDRAFEVTTATTAVLDATLGAEPATVTAGQTVTVTLSVRNVGGAAALDVVPDPLERTGAGAVGAAVSGPAPASVARLEAGASTAFTWTVTAAAAGTLSLAASARASDEPTAIAVSSNVATASAEVLPPAELTPAFSASRSSVNVGQAVTVTLALVNGGGTGVTVSAVTPSITPSTAASCTAAAPAPPLELPAGGTVTFGWTCVATAEGSYALGAAVSGLEIPTSAPVALDLGPLPLEVQQPASLSASIAVAGDGIVAVGQPASVTFTLSNGGGATVNLAGVVPSTGGAAAGCTAPSPAPPLAIPGRSSAVFTWTCTPSATGTLVLSGSASGTDANSDAALAAVADPGATVLVVDTGSATVTSFTAAPAPVNTGQATTVTLTLSNPGGTAVTVQTVTPSIAPAASSGCTAAKPALPRSLLAGGAITFTWTCTASAAGDYVLGAAVAGVDAVTDAPVSVGAGPVGLAIQTPAALVAQLAVAPPDPLMVGQAAGATLTVTDVGGAAATLTTVTPTVSGDAAATCTAASPAPPRTVAGGGGTAILTWTCTATRSGTVTMSATVRGTDANDGSAADASANPGVTRSVVSGTALGIVAFEASRAVVDTGQPVAVTLTIGNGGVSAGTVTSLGPTLSGAEASCGGPSPAPPVPVSAGGSVSFTWSCAADTAGDRTLSATIGATDAGGDAVHLSPTPIPIAVQRPASLSGTIALVPTSVPIDTPSAVTLTLRNGGQATARVSALAPTVDPPGASCTPAAAAFPLDVAGGASVDVGWTCTGASAGTYAVGVLGAAVDVNTLGAVAIDAPAATLTVGGDSGLGAGEVVLVAVDPLGDGTAAPSLGESGSEVWVGPARDGRTFAWLDPSGARAPALRETEPAARAAAAPGTPGQLALAAPLSPGSGDVAPAGVTAMATVEGIVYAADAAGISRSAPGADGASAAWMDVTPSAWPWRARAAVTPEPASDGEAWRARDRAVPAIVAFGACGGGPCVFAARNVEGRPGEPPVAAQLWRCAPSAGPGACRPEDWSLAAPGADVPLTRLGDVGSEALTILAATPRWLYVGLDAAAGVRLFRALAPPREARDLLGHGRCEAGARGCEGLGGDGLGDRRVTRVLDAKVLAAGGAPSLWIVAGDGIGPARVYRVRE